MLKYKKITYFSHYSHKKRTAFHLGNGEERLSSLSAYMEHNPSISYQIYERLNLNIS